MQDYYYGRQPRQPSTGTADSMQSGMSADFTGAMPAGMPGTYPCGIPIGMIPDAMPGGFAWQSADPPPGGPSGMPPFGQPPGGAFPGSPPGAPPFGQFPGGAPGGPGQGFGQPPGPPPTFVPSQAVQQQSIGALSINPGAIRPCMFRYVYLWLDNGQQFWAWLLFVGSTSVSGWRWTGFRWIFFGIDTRRISSFACY